jgi:hypothetical protein
MMRLTAEVVEIRICSALWGVWSLLACYGIRSHRSAQGQSVFAVGGDSGRRLPKNAARIGDRSRLL